MPSFNDILSQIQTLQQQGRADAADHVRSSHLLALHQYTRRNIICYYSGFLSTPSANNLSIDDLDKNGFMNAVEGMDCSLGLDLILHTPGGGITAAESLVYYLRQKFGTDIRVLIPQMAMSAGTMIACASKEIIMGHQSCIGPFDPNVRQVSAFAIFDEFKRASDQIKNEPHTIPLWQAMLSKYPPAFLEECERAIDLAKQIVPRWLRECMLQSLSDKDREDAIEKILETLCNPTKTKEHSRHIHFNEAHSIGLNVTQLEADQQLQNLVLSTHHAYMCSLLLSKIAKIIESHHGKRFILN